MKDTRTPLQELSKQQFGSEHRLTVCMELLRSDEMTSSNELADRMGVSRSPCHKDLNILVAAGAVRRVPIERSVVYLRVDGPFWRWVEELLSAFSSETGKTKADPAPTSKS